MAQFFNALTSSNINRFSKLFHCRNQEKTCNNTITAEPTTPQVCCYTTLWNVKCLESNNWNQGDSCNNTFLKIKINNKEQRVYCLNYCLKRLTCCSFFTSNVQFVRLAAGRPTQAGDTTDQWRHRWNAPTVCSTGCDDCLYSSPGCLGATCEVRWTWRSHAAGTSVCSWQCVTARRPAADIRARCQRYSCKMWQLL